MKCVDCKFLGSMDLRMKMHRCFAVTEGSIPPEIIDKEMECKLYADKTAKEKTGADKAKGGQRF